MMMGSYKLLVAFLIMLTGLFGCATTNSFTPEQKKTDLVFTYTVTEGGDVVTAFCPVTEIYMVMPEEGGRVGTVDVTLKDGQKVVLQGEYSTLNIAGSQAHSFTSNDEDMNKVFGKAIAGLPKAPLSANLYFITGGDILTSASAKEAEEIVKKIVQRQSVEVLISGHTDTVGSSASNLVLSNQRAKMVSKKLIKNGVTSKTIKTMGHGEAELSINTVDEVDEQKNRRVEINVR